MEKENKQKPIELNRKEMKIDSSTTRRYIKKTQSTG